MKNHKQPYPYKFIYLLIFLLSITDALASYSQSSFLNQFFSLSAIGVIVMFCAAATIVASVWLPKMIDRFSLYKVGLIFSGLALWTTVMLIISRLPWLIAGFFFLRYLALIFILVILDIFLEKISRDKTTGFIRSLYLTVINIAWLISPWLMGKLIGENHYTNVYMAGSLTIGIFFVLLLINRRRLRGIKTAATDKNINLPAALRKMVGSRNLRGVFFSVIALNIFYALAVLYIPIHLHNNLGFDWPTIGLIFTFMLLPFVLLQFPAGLLSDKYLGEKEMLILGNIIIAVCALIICFTNSQQVAFWAILLFASRIGAALMESMQEIYFYKQINVKNISLINLFRQSRSLGWIIGTFLAFSLLKFVSIPSLFLAVMIIMCLNILQLQFIKDTK